MDAHFSFRVTESQTGSTLISCLDGAIPYLSQSQWLRLIERQLVTLDGNHVAANQTVIAKQTVRYTVTDYEEAEVDTRWRILWQNEDLVAVHKPANLPVNRTTRNVYNTLIQLVRRQTPWYDAHLLHRLDQETSGVMVLAKHHSAVLKYSHCLNDWLITKEYRAWVHDTPAWQEIDYRCDLATRSDSEIRSQMYVVEAGKGKVSRTEFTQLLSGNNASLIECRLHSGRKHQIRAQLSSLGHPIIGDKIYSNGGSYYLKRIEGKLTPEDEKALLSPHHLLHAYRCILNLNGEEIEIIDDEYPDAFAQYFAQYDA